MSRQGRRWRLFARTVAPAMVLSLACSLDRSITSDGWQVEPDEPAFAATPTRTAPASESAMVRVEPERAVTSEPPLTSPEQIAEQLADAQAKLRELGVRAKFRAAPSGPMPELALLESAYADGRGFSVSGDLEEVREWMGLAKFAARDPETTPAAGVLVRYDLIVTRDDDRAWLHVIVPARGLPEDGRRGRHEAFVEGERWLNLADLAQPGRDYQPYKTNGNESLHHQWGRADVVEGIVVIAEEYRARTGHLLGVGDISRVTGGKIPDHWTHQDGVDADVYLLDHARADDEGRASVWWHHYKKSESIWSTQPQGKGDRELKLDPNDELSDTPTSQRLRVLAQIVFPIDPIGYFVHDDPVVLAGFDAEVGERRQGRRYLHAKNRGMWPRHCDHVHLRWVDGELPVGGTPRP